MAKEEEKETTETAPAAKGSKKKLFIIIGGVVFLILAAGIPVLYFTVLAPKTELDPDAITEGEEGSVPLEGNLEEDELEEGEKAIGAIYPLDTFVLNLADGKFIRAQLQLEFSDRDVPKRFYSKQVLVRDALISLITAKKSDVLSAEDGKETLKKEVKDKVNEVLNRQDVENVYLTQFVIQ